MTIAIPREGQPVLDAYHMIAGTVLPTVGMQNSNLGMARFWITEADLPDPGFRALRPSRHRRPRTLTVCDSNHGSAEAFMRA